MQQRSSNTSLSESQNQSQSSNVGRDTGWDRTGNDGKPRNRIKRAPGPRFKHNPCETGAGVQSQSFCKGGVGKPNWMQSPLLPPCRSQLTVHTCPQLLSTGCIGDRLGNTVYRHDSHSEQSLTWYPCPLPLHINLHKQLSPRAINQNVFGSKKVTSEV